MPLAEKTSNDEKCPRCGEEEEIYVHEKVEANTVKLQYTCDECLCEWTDTVSPDSDKRL